MAAIPRQGEGLPDDRTERDPGQRREAASRILAGTRTFHELSALVREWEDRSGRCDNPDTAQTSRQCASGLREIGRPGREPGQLARER